MASYTPVLGPFSVFSTRSVSRALGLTMTALILYDQRANSPLRRSCCRHVSLHISLHGD